MLTNQPNFSKKILDHGQLVLIDSMGSDKSVVNAARISIEAGKRERTPSESADAKLIKYLAKHEHTSPFEHCVATFYVKAPIFVVRQWHRHRTQSYNEVSGRYSTTFFNEFYLPSVQRLMTEGTQDSRQGSGAISDTFVAVEAYNQMKAANEAAFRSYESLLQAGVSKELARTVLPVSTYTEFYTTANLLNWCKFVRSRRDNLAQLEIREYAQAIGEALYLLYPRSIEAWNLRPLP